MERGHVMKQPDLFGAIAARDEGMQRVMENAGTWQRQAKLAMRRLRWRGEWTGEAIRHAIMRHVGEPHDPHVWGSLINWALRQELIAKYGRAKMQDHKSHARETPTYLCLSWETDAKTS